mgnify:CR=1 FL=1
MLLQKALQVWVWVWAMTAFDLLMALCAEDARLQGLQPPEEVTGEVNLHAARLG